MAKNKKPRKLTYWEKRAVINEQELQNRIKPIESEITNAYLKAQTYLTEQVHKIYNRVKNKNDFGEDELKRILNQKIEPSELVELKRLSNDLADKGLQESAKKQLNAIAAKGRITRLEDLKAKSHLVSKQIADVQLEKSTDFLVEEIHEAYNEATSEALINQIEPDSRIEVWNKKEYRKTSHEFKELSTEYTKNILDSHWHGSNYSKRIWGDTNALANRLEELFTVESMTGMSEQEMAKAIANEFGRSIGVSRRLIRTEANYMANQAKLKGWRDRGVKQYMLVAVLDLRTSNICQGKDGKIFDVVDAVVNGKDGNYPPFHPWCRTVAIAYYGERSVKGNRIANDPISGKTFTIKKSDTYNDWMDTLKQLYSDGEIEQQKKKIRNSSKDLSDYRKLKTALGKENSPKSLEDYQNIKYNDTEQWDQLKKTYRDVKWMRECLDSTHLILNKTNEVRALPFTHKKNSVIDFHIDGNVERRRFYGKTGKPKLDIDYSNHGNAKEHPIVPHAHSWTSYERSKGRIVLQRENKWRELSNAEKIANLIGDDK